MPPPFFSNNIAGGRIVRHLKHVCMYICVLYSIYIETQESEYSPNFPLWVSLAHRERVTTYICKT